MFLRFIRFMARMLIWIVADVEIVGLVNAPKTGGCVAVSNHNGRLDAILALVLPERDDIIMAIAEKYQSHPFWRYWGYHFDVVWLNRFEADFRAMRELVRRLKAGGIMALAPEGTRSKTGQMGEGRHGAAFLAAKANVPILPIGLIGTQDDDVRAKLKRLRRLKIKIVVGDSFYLSPLKGKGRAEVMQTHTDEIMCQIAALLPESYRGVYVGHPRLRALLGVPVCNEQG